MGNRNFFTGDPQERPPERAWPPGFGRRARKTLEPGLVHDLAHSKERARESVPPKSWLSFLRLDRRHKQKSTGSSDLPESLALFANRSLRRNWRPRQFRQDFRASFRPRPVVPTNRQWKARATTAPETEKPRQIPDYGKGLLIGSTRYGLQSDEQTLTR